MRQFQSKLNEFKHKEIEQNLGGKPMKKPAAKKTCILKSQNYND